MNWLKEAKRRYKVGGITLDGLQVMGILALAQAVEHLALAQAGWTPGDHSPPDDLWNEDEKSEDDDAA